MFQKYFIFFFILLCFIQLISCSSPSLQDSSYYFPTNYLTITSSYGHREIYGQVNFHNGTDFGAPQNSEVYAISSGVVTHVGFLNGYGNSILILHPNGFRSLYAHLSEEFLVKIGDPIFPHQLIAHVGPKILSNGIPNGFTTGPHLHLTIYDTNQKTIDPLSLDFQT